MKAGRYHMPSPYGGDSEKELLSKYEGVKQLTS